MNLDADVGGLSAAAAADKPLPATELGQALAQELVARLADKDSRTALNGNTDFTTQPMTALKVAIRTVALLADTVPSATADSVKAGMDAQHTKYGTRLETFFFAPKPLLNQHQGVIPSLKVIEANMGRLANSYAGSVDLHRDENAKMYGILQSAFEDATKKLMAAVAGRELAFEGRNTTVTDREIKVLERETAVGKLEGEVNAAHGRLVADRAALVDAQEAFQRLGFWGKIQSAFASRRS